MNDEKKTISCQITGGGIAAVHPSQDIYTVLAAPSTSNEFNLLKAGILPTACWRLEDVRFEFDSSFITPSAAEEFKHLATLMKEHPGSAISIFGHADPVGDDDYNKKLSGRRATAVYGMLTRNTDLWEELYSNPLGRDDWKNTVIQIILLDLGYSPGSADDKKSQETTDAIKQFQTDNGLPASGNADRTTRIKLFLAYMDKHCRDRDHNPFIVDKKDFLAQGADPGGKGDYQGCGEFNPVLMFSKEENDEYSKKENKTKRDSENAPNRRVLIYLFRPGRHVSPKSWPCPRVKEGVGGCKLRFWSDAAKRRSFQEERREYDKTHDTFACRFYDVRLSINSPCESIMRFYSVRLFDPFLRPIPFAPYRMNTAGQTTEGKADSNGWARGKYVLSESTKKGLEKTIVEWGYRPLTASAPPAFVFSSEIYMDVDAPDEATAADRRLHNLGYRIGKKLEDRIRSFQRAYGRLESGELKDIKEDLWKYHDEANPESLPNAKSEEPMET
jgi:hypothetical protein